MFHSITFSSYIYSLTLQLSDHICNSPYYQPYDSYNAGSENLLLVLDQVIIPNWYFYLVSSLIWLILYWYCKEKFCLGHSWELKGKLIYFSFHSLIHPCVSSSSFPPAHSTPEHTYHPSLPLTKQCNRKRSSTCVFFNIKKEKKANKNLLPQVYKNNSIQRLWNNRERTFSWRQILAWVYVWLESTNINK